MWKHSNDKHFWDIYLYPSEINRLASDVFGLNAGEKLLATLQVPRQLIISKAHHVRVRELYARIGEVPQFGGLSIQEIPDTFRCDYDVWVDALAAELTTMKQLFGHKFFGLEIKDIPIFNLIDRTVIVDSDDPAVILDAVTRALYSKKTRIKTPRTLIVMGEAYAQIGDLHVATLNITGPVPDIPSKWRAKAAGNINFRSEPHMVGTFISVVMNGTEFWVLNKSSTNGYLNVALLDGQIGWLYEIYKGQRLIEYLE